MSCGTCRRVEIQVTDKIYCTCIAPNEEMIPQHAEQGGFPADRVSEIRSTIDPTTAKGSDHREGLTYPEVTSGTDRVLE